MNLSRNFLIFVFIAFASATLLFVFNSPFVPVSGWTGHDSESYIMISEGRINEVIRPFSGRFLFPFIAGWLSDNILHDTTKAFLLLSFTSLLSFYVIVSLMLREAVPKPVLLLPLFLLPYFSELLREFFPPDIFYAFLSAVFFFLLLKGKDAASLVVLFMMFLTRESTILIGAVFLVFSLVRGKKLLALGIVATILISVFVSGSVNALGEPNAYNLSSPFYLVMKLGYNFLANVLGVRLWVDAYTFCEPVWKIMAPSFGFLGSIKEIGLCGFDSTFPMSTLISLLGVFGIMPLILFSSLSGRWRKAVNDAPLWLSLALMYGILHYFLGIVAGTGVFRIVGYGWPAFLLATPFFAKEIGSLGGKRLPILLVLHLIVAWTPFFAIRAVGTTQGSLLFVLVVVFSGYVCAWRLLSERRGEI